jgi:hypothetical protein
VQENGFLLLGVTNMKLDAEFCETRCPVCTRARKGNALAKIIQKLEMLLTFGGCPAGRDRQKKYGVNPNEGRP